MTPERRNGSCGKRRVNTDEGFVNGKFTSTLHCGKHREYSGCPSSNSKQLN